MDFDSKQLSSLVRKEGFKRISPIEYQTVGTHAGYGILMTVKKVDGVWKFYVNEDDRGVIRDGISEIRLRCKNIWKLLESTQPNATDAGNVLREPQYREAMRKYFLADDGGKSANMEYLADPNSKECIDFMNRLY
jgi:hypothetical protein